MNVPLNTLSGEELRLSLGGKRLLIVEKCPLLFVPHIVQNSAVERDPK